MIRVLAWIAISVIVIFASMYLGAIWLVNHLNWGWN